jgi:hypothetical protein
MYEENEDVTLCVTRTALFVYVQNFTASIMIIIIVGQESYNYIERY